MIDEIIDTQEERIKALQKTVLILQEKTLVIGELEAKLKVAIKALESIAKDYDRPSDMMKKAREALKELDKNK